MDKKVQLWDPYVAPLNVLQVRGRRGRVPDGRPSRSSLSRARGRLPRARRCAAAPLTPPHPPPPPPRARARQVLTLQSLRSFHEGADMPAAAREYNPSNPEVIDLLSRCARRQARSRRKARAAPASAAPAEPAAVTLRPRR